MSQIKPGGKTLTTKPDVPLAENNGSNFVLEEKQRLSKSILWQLQREFYDRHGVSAWNNGTVPSYVTSNPFIVKAYAQIVLGFLRDYCLASDPNLSSGPFDPSQPIFIIELGAGAGRFGYLFLKKLLALKHALPATGVQFRYIMTDFTESNLEFLNSHALLQPFFDEGLLDLAQFDLERDKTFTLKRSGEVLSAETIRNPVIVFANYVFDTTRQDLFRIERGQLREGLITSVSEREQEPDLTDPQLIERITNRYEYRPLEADYYEDPILNQILQAYEERLNDTTILFPISALDCIRRLIDLAGGRLLLLSSDKGHAYEDELISLKGPYIARHGSFSMMVNYHAIERYFRHRGGMALHASPRGNASLTTSAFFLDGAPATGSEVQREFQEAINGFGPTDFYNLVGSTHKKSASLQLILSLLRLSGWDTSLILRFKEALIDQVETVTESLKRELRWAIDRVWDNYFPIDEKEDLPFELARIFYAMNRSHDALRYGEHSIRLFGEHYVTLYNMGLSYYRLEQLPEALRYFNRALELEPAYGPARGWRIRVQAELDGDVGSGDLSVLPEIKSEILRGSTTLNQNGSNEREEKIDLEPVKVGVS